MKKLLFILIILLSLYFLAIWTFNKIQLPRYVKITEERLASLTNSAVSIERPRASWNKIKIAKVNFISPDGEKLVFKDIKAKYNLWNALKKNYKISLIAKASSEGYRAEKINLRFSYLKEKDILNLDIDIPEIDMRLLNNGIKLLYPQHPWREIDLQAGDVRLLLSLHKEGKIFTLKIASSVKNPTLAIKDNLFKAEDIAVGGKITNSKVILRGNVSDLTISNPKGEILEKGYSEFEIELPEMIKLRNTRFTMKDAYPIRADIIVKDPQNKPNIEIKARSEPFQINLKTSYKEKNYEIEKLEISGLDSRLELKGNITPSKKISLSGDGILAWQDLKQFLKDNFLQDLDFQLAVDSFSLNYNLATKETYSKLKARFSELFYQNNILSKKGTVEAKLENESIIIEKFQLQDRMGIATLAGIIFIDNSRRSHLSLRLKSYPIENIVYFLNKKKNQKGFLDAELKATGIITDKKTYRAQGEWMIYNAEIANLKLLGPLADLMGMPEFREIKFNSGKGSFQLADEVFYIKDTYLYAPNLELDIKGKIGFDHSIDLTTTTKFKGIKGDNLNIWKALGRYIWKIAGQLFYKFRITGTIEDPKYQLIPSPVEQFFDRLGF